jgi:small subunit ribosomal protein S17
MSRIKNTGMQITPPTQSCEDRNCPFHGNLKIRGKQFTGTIVSDKMQKSAVVEWTVWRFLPKYERYKKIRTTVSAHNPKCVDAKEGDIVLISECRPLSKTKNFVIIQVKGKERTFEIKKETEEESKHKIKAKEAANEAAKEAAKPKKKPVKAVKTEE